MILPPEWMAHEKDFAVALDSRSPSFFETHVRNLCLDVTMSSEYVERVLSICTGVRDLALWKRPRTFDISPVVKLRLRSLDAYLAIICDLSKLHQTFPELVCLSASCQWDSEVMPSLEWLPALTHVHLKVGRYNDLVPATIRVVLQTSRSLQSILIQIDHSEKWYYNRARAKVKHWGEEDPRIIIDDTSSDHGRWRARDWEESGMQILIWLPSFTTFSRAIAGDEYIPVVQQVVRE